MSSTFRILLIEPESQSLLFFLVNAVIFIYILIFVVTWPYTLFYLIGHLGIFSVINNRLSAGRLYIPTKNLVGQTVVVTGAATGIGRATALQLAKLEAIVIVGIRDQERAERVAKELSKESHGNVIGYHLDLTDLSSVKRFAEKIDKVDILINNAGVAKQNKELTKDDLETTFGTNHIGHFYLTQLLLPLLIQSNGRIVNVSSISHIFSSDNVDFSESNAYNVYVAYAESKLANILHVVELQRRYGDRGIKAYSLHPGAIPSTQIGGEKKPIQSVLRILITIFSRTIDQGAMTTLYCALSDEAKPGKYHSNCRIAQPSPVAYNLKKARELWKFSEQIINAKTKYL